ncbi:LAGLIDADG family homing endonuclease [Sporosarcina sp. HYO08]|uniref:LAGLIDADG family homing endonuclease n=1 Tax=Sporosarcina sp. HYO08 TaxID=1759557 RepID=UPI0007962923|nr:LAGLIDADG family homing endonuclease [Sporosarcina sp. HYO08]KXH86927.1 hypothetical protein AU377_13350 [Sporosarcina sp. HYO08]
MAYMNTCYGCSEKFEVKQPSNQDPENKKRFIKYCSKECRSAAQSKNTASRNKNRPKKETVEYINTCYLCENKFPVTQKKQHNPKDVKHFKKFCSPECLARFRSINTKRNFELGRYEGQGNRIKETYSKKREERTGMTLNEVIALYVETDISINQLAVKSGYTREMISMELEKRGVEKDNHLREIQDRIELAIAEYQGDQSITITDLEEKHDVSRVTLSKHLKQQGVEIRNPLQKHAYDENYFESIDTEEKAYWLGFLAADGCVVEGKTSKTVELGLSAIDKDHVEKFVAAIGGENTMVKERIAKSKGKAYPSVRVTVSCTKMANDLIEKDITPRKSHTLQFSTFLPEDLMRHYMRGYFDGDGGVHVRNETTISINMVGNEQFLLDYMQKLDDLLGIPIRKLYSKQDSTVKTIYYYGQDAKAILNFFYQDAAIYLNRKQHKYYQALELLKAKEEGESAQPRLF